MRRGAPSRRPPAAGPSQGRADEPSPLAVRAWVRILAVQKRGLSAIRLDLEREMTLPRFDLLANLVRSDGVSGGGLPLPSGLSVLMMRSSRSRSSRNAAIAMATSAGSPS